MRRMTWIVLAATALAGLALTARSAMAAPVATTGRPLAPAIGFAPTYNTYLLVWAEDRGLGTGLDIYAARTTASGIVVGYEFPIVVAPGDQSDPALAFSERLNDYLVMFTTDGLVGPPNPESTPGLPPPGSTSTPMFPTPPPPPIPFGAGVAEHPGGGMADPSLGLTEHPGGGPADPSLGLTWAAIPGDAHLALAGVQGNPDQPPPPPTPPPPGQPTATTVPGGPTVTPGVPPPVTSTGQRDIYGTWVTASGQRVSNIFAVIASPADDTYPALASFRRSVNDERFALVWREVTGTAVALSVYEFLGGPGYYIVWDSAKGNVAGGGDQGRPSVAVESSGEYMVTWAQTQAGADNRDILGRRLNANAWPYGAARVLMDGPADQVYPSIGAIRSSGGYLMVWEERTPGAVPDIRTRRLNRNGVAYGAAYTLAGGPPFSFAPTLPTTDRSSLLLGWLDRNAASDLSIMGAEVTREGRRVGPERVLVQGGSGPGGLTPAPPPPFPTPPPPPPPIP